MQIGWYILAAAAAIIAAALFSKTKVHIDTAKGGKNIFDVRFYVLGIRLVKLGAKLSMERYVNPRLDVGLWKNTFHIYLFERREGPPVKSLYIEKLLVKGHIGLDDAAGTALIAGLVNVIGQMYAFSAGRPDWKIGAVPIFGKETFYITGSCILSVRIADIIIATAGKKLKKARKK